MAASNALTASPRIHQIIAKVVCKWLSELGVTTQFIEPASPRENGYIELFNGKLRDELVNGEIFYTVRQAQILLVANWPRLYSSLPPHSSQGQRRPAP